MVVMGRLRSLGWLAIKIFILLSFMSSERVPFLYQNF